MSVLAIAIFASLVSVQGIDVPCHGALNVLRPYINAALSDSVGRGDELSLAIDRICPHSARLRALSYAIDFAKSDLGVDEAQAAMNLSHAIDGSDYEVSIRIARLALSMRAYRLGLCRSVFDVIENLGRLQLDDPELRNALLLSAARRGDRAAAFNFARDSLNHTNGDRRLATQIMLALMETETEESGREELGRIVQQLGSVPKRSATVEEWARLLTPKTHCEIDPLLFLENP